MNLKTVLRTYSLLRQLTEDETALLNTLRGMNDGERELLVESLSPQKGTGKGIKKRKPATSKSSRAQSLATAIQQTPKSQIVGACDKCAQPQDYGVHDPTAGYSSYHEFVAPDVQAAGVGD